MDTKQAFLAGLHIGRDMEGDEPNYGNDEALWAEWSIACLAMPGTGHGLTCPKVAHTPGRTGYLHGEYDDGRYWVDGVSYCGRCHHGIDEQTRK